MEYGPAAVEALSVPDLGASGSATVLASHVEETEGPKLDEAGVVVSGGDRQRVGSFHETGCTAR